MERTEDGRQLRILVVIEAFTRECLAIEVARSFTARGVIMTLQHLFAQRGAPEHLRSDNGPEFVAKEIQAWLASACVRTLSIQKASPWENGYVESFNGRLHDELLDRVLFLSLPWRVCVAFDAVQHERPDGERGDVPGGDAGREHPLGHDGFGHRRRRRGAVDHRQQRFDAGMDQRIGQSVQSDGRHLPEPAGERVRHVQRQRQGDATTAADNGARYKVKVTNAAGSATSIDATLRV